MTAGAAVFHRHEIETPAPLRAPGGRLKLTGWCLAPGATAAPLVRLAGAARTFNRTAAFPRADVVAALAAAAGANDCGFVIEGRLLPGAHRLILEASADGRDWEPVRELTVVATVDELHAAIEWPAGPIVRESMRLQGWCAHPNFVVAEVWLHYGNRQIRCEYGLPRADVPRLLPDAPGAERSGFITPRNIPVGYGPVRLRAVTTTGEVFFHALPLTVDIVTDEENPEPLDLRGEFPDLGPARRLPRPPSAAAQPETPRRILFALYGDFTSNSALHVAGLAGALTARGHECVVAVPHHPETIRYHPHAAFRAVSFAEVLAAPGVFRDGRTADVVHAWTTRENVRQFCDALQLVQPAARVVHLEDNEMSLLEAQLGRPGPELASLPDEELARLVPPTLSHPRHSRTFLQSAGAVTIIVERLRKLVPPGPAVHLFWPAADASAFFPRPSPVAVRRYLGWDDAHTVLFYPGNVHATNAAEVRELYAAVVLLNESGVPTTLVRTGRDDREFLGDLAARVAPHVLALGRIDQHEHLAPLLALADFFVQPGTADAFNDYRFPSKLPEFFSLGRPVILPRTNLGEIVRHGEHAWVLPRADAAGIAGAVRTLRADPALRARLSAGALAFAAEHFRWERSAATVLAAYNSLLTRA